MMHDHEYISCRTLKRFVRLVRLVFEKNIYSRMYFIRLTTNLPNPTNTYHVATYKIRQIRAISVRKTYSCMNYIKLTTRFVEDPLTKGK